MCTSTYRGPDSGLLPWRSQTNAQMYRDPDSGPLRQRSQTYAWSCRGLWFLPTPLEVPDLWPDPQRSWLRPRSLEIPYSHLNQQGSWLRYTPLKIPDSFPDLQRSLWPQSTHSVVALLYLLQWSSLSQVYSSPGCWLSPALHKLILNQLYHHGRLGFSNSSNSQEFLFSDLEPDSLCSSMPRLPPSTLGPCVSFRS